MIGNVRYLMWYVITQKELAVVVALCDNLMRLPTWTILSEYFQWNRFSLHFATALQPIASIHHIAQHVSSYISCNYFVFHLNLNLNLIFVSRVNCGYDLLWPTCCWKPTINQQPSNPTTTLTGNKLAVWTVWYKNISNSNTVDLTSEQITSQTSVWMWAKICLTLIACIA